MAAVVLEVAPAEEAVVVEAVAAVLAAAEDKPANMHLLFLLFFISFLPQQCIAIDDLTMSSKTISIAQL